jgi:cytidylate kinase
MSKNTSPDTLTDILTIDGPAGAGKSTIAKRLALELKFAFLDTGAMYRAATWWALHNGVDMTDRDALAESTATIPLKMHEKNAVLTVIVDGTDVSEAIRTPEVTNAIKSLDGIPSVREKMVDLQREIASQGPTVADGRDMGTVVFPNAKWKIFLEASLEERTRRRAEELTQKGIPFDPETLQTDIHARDENDRNRAISPLRPANDAWILDTSSLTLADVESVILKHVREGQ